MTLRPSLLVAAILAGCATTPARAHGGLSVGITFPAPAVEAVPLHRPGQVWVAGHWEWGFGSYVWVPGYWVAARPGHRWVPHRWVQVGPRWHLHGGRWERAHRGGHARGHHMF